MMPLTDGMFALERRVDILSPSEIRVSLVPFGNQDRDLSRYISALTSITGVRVTQNVALRLLFEGTSG